MMDLYAIGREAIHLFWGPVIVWTACALLWMLLVRVLPRAYPQLRLDGSTALMTALPLALLVSWMLPESISAPLSAVIPEPGTSSASFVEVVSSSSALSPIDTWSWVEMVGFVSLLLALFSLVSAGKMTRSWWSLRRLLTRSSPLLVQAVTDDRVPNGRILISEDVRVPFTCGLIRPAIVLPANLDPADQEIILRHEQAHIAHGDLWRTWLAGLVRSVFVFHPITHWLHRDIALQAEICCDRRVMNESPQSPKHYAQLLLRQSPVTVGPVPALPLVSSTSQLKQRIQAMQTPTRLSLSRLSMFAWMLLITASVGLLAGCSEMEVAPTEPHVSDDAYDLVMELPAAKGSFSDEVFVVVEEAPIMMGGIEELQSRIKYPELAKKAGIAGRVFIQFVVDQEGNVTEPQVVRGIGAGADEEALRAVQTMKFIPGVQRGQRVNVKMSVPVTFRLGEYDESLPPPPPPMTAEEARADQ